MTMMTTEMDPNNKSFRFQVSGFENLKQNRKPQSVNRKSESGMSLLAVMAVMTIFAVALLAVAPSIQIEVQREKELEAIRRGEEVAFAIEQYVKYHNGAKLPNSIDDLLEGLPQGTKKRQILRASAAIDPLSEDGKWQLVPADKMKSFTSRVLKYNNGALPMSNNLPQNIARQVGILITNLDTKSEDDVTAPADETDSETFSTSNNPFIGVVSQSKSKSVIAYYGIENHSKWVFTPLFRGSGQLQFTGTTPRPPNANIQP
jgi:type II secretory pathway pseudopilin PulG